VVEDQGGLSTRRLVDTPEELDVLEELLEGSKPPPPPEAEPLHRLLVAPFRYPPLRWGSRFGVRWRRGIWYGSDRQRTAMAEVCFYRLRFLDDTDADLGALELRLLALKARVRTRRGIDLRRAPFDGVQDALASPTSYAATQPLGDAMRDDGVEAARFASARDPGGVNVAVFEPTALDPNPTQLLPWTARVERAAGEFWPSGEPSAALRFLRAGFEVGGRLPAPSA
jgi:hypothetical protein